MIVTAAINWQFIQDVAMDVRGVVVMKTDISYYTPAFFRYLKVSGDKD